MATTRGRGIARKYGAPLAMAAVQQLSAAYPLGSRLDEAGELEIGGCRARELAREFGTPCYVVAEDDLRARARAFLAAFRARTERFDVLFATKAFPCTAVMRVLREEGLGCDVASAGELHLALRAGFDPARIVPRSARGSATSCSTTTTRSIASSAWPPAARSASCCA